MSRRKSVLAILLALGLMVLVSACGGSSSSSSGSTTASASGGEAAESEEAEGGGEEIVPAPPTEPLTEMPITDPTKPPVPHQKIVWLACETPACQRGLSAGYRDAAKALGWDFTQLTYDSTEPAKAVQNAISMNPDIIMITGAPLAAWEAQDKEAVEKGIKIFTGFDPDTTPDPKTNGIYMDFLNAAGFAVQTKQLADWIINDSGGNAHVVSVTIPEYPALKASTEAFAEELSEKCDGCSDEELTVSSEELGAGKGPSKIVAYLQQKPETNYIEFAAPELVTGVEAGLEAAALGEKPKMTGILATETVVQEIIDGKQVAWTTQAQEFDGWQSMDGAVRAVEGLPLTKYQQEGNAPSWVVDTKPAAETLLEEGGEWPGPKGFQQKFEELWGVK
jgi:ribose transport system substrate-binding protein